MDTDNSGVWPKGKWGGAKNKGRWAKGGNMGTSVIVSTIKMNLINVTKFIALLLSELFYNLRTL